MSHCVLLSLTYKHDASTYMPQFYINVFRRKDKKIKEKVKEQTMIKISVEHQSTNKGNGISINDHEGSRGMWMQGSTHTQSQGIGKRKGG